MADEKEISPGGSQIHRYTERLHEPFSTDLGEDSLEQISAHIEKFIGTPATVFHEIVSDLVHIDVHIVEPTPERDFYTLVTSGMSDKAMVSAPLPDFRFAELLIALPAGWELDQQAFEKGENYWPVGILKMFARFPHEFDTWIWEGHTIPNGDPPQPYAINTAMACSLISYPILSPQEFQVLEISPQKKIHFLSIIPIYTEEMHFKLEQGTEALYDLFDRHNVSELLDPTRHNCCI